MACSWCGWPPCKKGEFGTVHVVQNMFDKAFGSEIKDTAADAAAVAEDDAAVMGEQQCDVDPMDELDKLRPQSRRNQQSACRRKQKQPRASVRAVEMQKRPRCSGCEQGEVRTIHI